MDRLLLPMAPTLPNQRCGFLSREPPVAGLALGRQRHAHYAPMKALLCMVVDCGAKRLKVTTCTATAAAMFDIGRTGLSIDRRQFLAAPKIIEPFNPRLDLELIARLTDVGQIDRQ